MALTPTASSACAFPHEVSAFTQDVLLFPHHVAHFQNFLGNLLRFDIRRFEHAQSKHLVCVQSSRVSYD